MLESAPLRDSTSSLPPTCASHLQAELCFLQGIWQIPSSNDGTCVLVLNGASYVRSVQPVVRKGRWARRAATGISCFGQRRTGAEPVSWYQPDQCLPSKIRIGWTEDGVRWSMCALSTDWMGVRGEVKRGHSQFVLPATSSLEGRWHFGDLISRLRRWKSWKAIQAMS